MRSNVLYYKRVHLDVAWRAYPLKVETAQMLDYHGLFTKSSGNEYRHKPSIMKATSSL